MYWRWLRAERRVRRIALVSAQNKESAGASAGASAAADESTSGAASLPPVGITGLDPAWSRLVTAPDSQGALRTWHLLDTWHGRSPEGINTNDQTGTHESNVEGAKAHTTAPTLTLLCVHGNPSWSFLWRHVLASVPTNVRAIAVDQLDMGFSERSGVRRTLGMRVDDLCELTKVLGVSGPVVTLAHDWGGPISLGWALRHVAHLKGVVLTNTAVHQPEAASAPAVIRLIRSRGLLKLITVTTTAFIRGAIEMSRPALSADVRDGFNAPYKSAVRRAAIEDFVSDIPLDSSHESAAVLDEIAAGMDALASTPALLLWGPRDKVFSDLYLHDLERRLPHASVHRYPKAAHFVTEDADVAGAVRDWLGGLMRDENPSAVETKREPVTEVASRRALADFTQVDPEIEAVVQLAPTDASISFGELNTSVESLAAGMAAFGINKGDRIALLITPGIDLAKAVYACWRLGATLVLVDSGLGKAGMQQALRSAKPDYLMGIDKALVAAKLLGWPGKRIAVSSGRGAFKRGLGVITDIDSLSDLGLGKAVPDWPTADTPAALVFTSGSTGPSKGVLYLHGQIQAQRDALMNLYKITPNDTLVAAFAPFALYGPTMGITSMVPDMDVTKPGTLTAEALSTAITRIQATLVFASPAALVNIVATHSGVSAKTSAAHAAVRLVLSAGAPVRASLLNSARAVFSDASFQTPYGMTEALPVANISLDELEALEADAKPQDTDHRASTFGFGVCVGYPLDGVQISIDPLGDDGKPTGELTRNAGLLGEIIVQADHIGQGYDRLWHTNFLAAVSDGAHRSGDVGQLDSDGRLYVAGRLGHVINRAAGPLGPVACEQAIETSSDVALAAVVGVGPVGTQAVVAVLQMHESSWHSPGSASLELTDTVRACVGSLADIAAVLVVKKLPVDRRHNSKIDRTAVAVWAASMLAGDKQTAL